MRSDGGALDPDGPIAREIAELWWLMLALGVVAFAVFAGALVVALRRRDRADDGGGPSAGALRRLVVGGGVAMPAVVLVVVLAFTVDTMRAVPASAPAGALRIEVVGHQWWWEIRYPEHGFTTANELHLPVGRPVELRLRSADVIHSFWVPALAGKMDLLPDHETTLVVEADEPGRHRTQCAEFCGLQHAKMGLLVFAEPADEFVAWVAANREHADGPVDAAAARGRDVFFGAGCASCHTIRGTRATGHEAPDLTHVASRETIAAATLPFTRRHVREWLTDPQAIKRGVVMQPVSLSEAEIEDLLAYLDSLR